MSFHNLISSLKKSLTPRLHSLLEMLVFHWVRQELFPPLGNFFEKFIDSVTYTSNDLFFKSASKHLNFSFIPKPVLTINCCQIVVIDLYTCFMLMCQTIYSCKIFQGFCLIVVFMLKLLRFSQINLIRQRKQFFPLVYSFRQK